MCLFICISAVRIHNDELIVLKSPLGILIVGYAFLAFGLSVPISLQYYWHRYSCAKLYCGTEDYINRILSIARQYLFLIPISLGEIVHIYPKLLKFQMTRLRFFLIGVQIFILSLLFTNFICIRRCIACVGLWQHGKVVLLAILLPATMMVLCAEQKGDGMVKDDWHMNAAVPALLGVINGFVYSLIFDWVLLNVN